MIIRVIDSVIKKININMKIKKFQEGGAMPQQMPVEEAVPEQENPIMQLVDVFSQALQAGDCEMLAQGAQMFLEFVSQAMNQNNASGPVDQVPEGEPIFKKGGKIVSRKTSKKCKK